MMRLDMTMNNHKLVITRKSDKIVTYYLQGDTLVTVQAEVSADVSILGNIFVGRIQNIVTNINAAFVEIQRGIICYLPLADCENPIVLNRKYQGKLIAGDEILVQVTRDRVKTKDAVVSSQLSLSGKYAVVSYPNTKIGFSNKLSAPEKKALKDKITPFLNRTYGYVIRTNAMVFAGDGVLITPLQSELQQLTEQLDTIISTASTRSLYTQMYFTPEKYLNNLKNMYMNTLSKIITDDEEIFAQVKQYLKINQPEDMEKLSLYQDDMLSLEKLLRLETRLEEALQTNVWLKSGGYLVIEPTEALTVIDVNTGKYSAKKDMETTFMAINMEAAIEIAHQVRLRNLSGMIIIDFINMKDDASKDVLLQKLRECMKADPIRTNVIDITALGLVEVTRKKVEPSIQEQFRSYGR